MTEKQFWIGSLGPFIYNPDQSIDHNGVLVPEAPLSFETSEGLLIANVLEDHQNLDLLTDRILALELAERDKVDIVPFGPVVELPSICAMDVVGCEDWPELVMELDTEGNLDIVVAEIM